MEGIGMFYEYLPNLVYDFFSGSQFASKGSNDFTPDQAEGISDSFFEGLKQVKCFNTREELRETVSVILLEALRQMHIKDAETWVERFIADMDSEPLDLDFDDYRHMRIAGTLFRNAEENAPGAVMPKDDDLDVIFMARLFTRMPLFPNDHLKYARYGVCNEYEAQHMVWWFSEQITLGSGAYSRTAPNFSARKTWNGLRSWTSLLWIAISMGVEETTLDAAFAAMDEAGNLAAKCSAVRRHIPFETIRSLALKFLPDGRQIKKLARAFEHVGYIREKLDASQLIDLTSDLEKELLRTPVFDTQDEEAVEACFDPVAGYVLQRHGFTAEEFYDVASETCEALRHLAAN